MPTERERTKAAAREELSEARFATVTAVRYHTEASDNSNNEVDVELVAPGESSGVPVSNVHIGQPAPGMVCLPEKGTLVRVAPTGGPNGEPCVTGIYYDATDRAPLAREGDWRIRMGNAVFETRINGNDDRVVRVGRQPDDGGPLDMGLSMNFGTGTVNLNDASGEGISMDGNGNVEIAGLGGPGRSDAGGNGSPGSYESIPTGGAGGDGTGVGNPGFTPSNEVDAVADLGMDNNGNQPINSKINSVGGDTLVVFPPGTYRVNDEGNSGVVLGQNQLWLQGGGDKRSDVKFQFPGGTSARMFNFSGHVAVSNLVFDQSNHSANFINLGATGSADTYVYNCALVGRSPPQVDLPGPIVEEDSGVAAWNVAMENGTTCRIENYTYVDPESRILDYGLNTVGLQAPENHKGLLEIVNNHWANRAEHNIYASRAIGNVQITGGYFHNSINTNLRIEGAGSFVKDATVHVNMAQSRQVEQDTGQDKAVRGLRIENTKSSQQNGGYAENVDFIYETDMGGGDTSLVALDSNTGGWEFRNCRFLFDNNADNCCDISGNGVVFRDCSFTGSTSKLAIDGAGDTQVLDTCISMPNSGGFQGCIVRGKKTNNCTVASK